MTTINGHVLLPHNGWASGAPVKWSRRWQSGVGTGITGIEQRSALRAQPRHKLSCDLIATSLQERTRLDARVDAAMKCGLACLPFFGRAGVLLAAANAADVAITLVSVSSWPWAAGDYAVLMGDDTTFDVVQLTGLAGTTLNLQPLTLNWAAGKKVWPLLFGKFSCAREQALTDYHGGWPITIEQLVAERTAQIGVTAVPGPGVGQQKIGHTNRIA